MPRSPTGGPDDPPMASRRIVAAASSFNHEALSNSRALADYAALSYLRTERSAGSFTHHRRSGAVDYLASVPAVSAQRLAPKLLRI